MTSLTHSGAIGIASIQYNPVLLGEGKEKHMVIDERGSTTTSVESVFHLINADLSDLATRVEEFAMVTLKRVQRPDSTREEEGGATAGSRESGTDREDVMQRIRELNCTLTKLEETLTSFRTTHVQQRSLSTQVSRWLGKGERETTSSLLRAVDAKQQELQAITNHFTGIIGLQSKRKAIADLQASVV